MRGSLHRGGPYPFVLPCLDPDFAWPIHDVLLPSKRKINLLDRTLICCIADDIVPVVGQQFADDGRDVWIFRHLSHAWFYQQDLEARILALRPPDSKDIQQAAPREPLPPPSTLHPKPYTLNPTPSTLNHKDSKDIQQADSHESLLQHR